MIVIDTIGLAAFAMSWGYEWSTLKTGKGGSQIIFPDMDADQFRELRDAWSSPEWESLQRFFHAYKQMEIAKTNARHQNGECDNPVLLGLEKR